MNSRPRANLLTAAISVSLLAGVLGSCAVEPSGKVDGAAVAECSVCREKADLACLRVKINNDTPRAEYNGKTYYFCSQECKADFEKQPQKYAGR
jgi:YHS domain-containing protein